MTIDLIDWDDEDADVCGETYDHDQRITHDDEGGKTYVCDRCGAEWWEEDDE